jgi:Mrp family chromosome partitioning ATPase
VGYVFVSYSHTDRAYIHHLVQYLRTQGVESWFDDRLVPGGDSFGPRIQAAIDDGSAVLVVLTPDSVASTGVRRELVYAESKKKPILPVLLLDCDKPIELVALQYEDVRGGRMASPEFIERLRTLPPPPFDRDGVTPAAVASPSIAEEARRARRILNPDERIRMPRPPSTRVVSVWNPKGGGGKTATVVNIAVALALEGNRVLVIDLNPQGHASTGLERV